MFATDFLFDNQRASDLGLMICSFDGNSEAATGGEIEYNVVKTPERDNFTFYGSQLNSVLTWNFSICKNPCKNQNMFFDQYEESMIMKWLVKTDGYRWLQFDEDGYEDIFYKVCINSKPHQVIGKTIGFDVTATSDCAYGFTDIIKKKSILNNFGSLKFTVHSDLNTMILPKIYMEVECTNMHIYNRKISITNEGSSGVICNTMIFQNIIKPPSSKSGIITINSDTGTVDGLNDPNNFNWNFLKLRDGINIISTDYDVGFIHLEIQYREPRYVRC